jgi:hypothetical protein
MPGLRRDMGFETLKMDWLGSMSGRAYGVGVYTGSLDGSGATAKSLAAKFGASIKTVADAKKRTVIMGTSGKASTSYLGVWPDAIHDKLIAFVARIGPERDDMQHIPRLHDLLKTDRQREMLDILEVSFNVG